MTMIMVSYRRADQDASGRVADFLIARYGAECVFFDVNSIPSGASYRDRITQAIAGSNVVVAVIGPNWLGKSPNEPSMRINNPADSVRVEIETAQKLGKPIFPVLLNGTIMPAESDLPEPLRFLAGYHAARVDSGEDFRYHMTKLSAAIDRVCASPGARLLAPLKRFWMYGAGAMAAALAILAWSVSPSFERPLRATAPSTTSDGTVPQAVPATLTARAKAQGGFLFPDSDHRYLGDADIAGLSKVELRVARNEIFARHGRFFKDQTLANYFSQFSWYQPNAADVPISDLEQTNVNMLLLAERK
jgi:hypothetical protein